MIDEMGEWGNGGEWEEFFGRGLDDFFGGFCNTFVTI